MDNFLDKLAEKYNAQDMIRANSEAENAQLQSLEDQVEAYEAVLQEMRKLNYKNSELTEKMYALVDGGVDSTMRDNVEEVLEKLFALQQSSSNAEESLAGLSRQLAEIKEAQAENLSRDLFVEQPAALSPELIEELSGLSRQIEELKQAQAEGTQNAGAFEELGRKIEELKEAQAAGVQNAEAFEQLSRQIAELKEVHEQSISRELPTEQLAGAQNLDAFEQLSRQLEELKESSNYGDAFLTLSRQLEEIRNLQSAGMEREIVAEEATAALSPELIEKLNSLSSQITELKLSQEQSISREIPVEQPAALSPELIEKLSSLSAQIEELKSSGQSNEQFEQLSRQIAELKEAQAAVSGSGTEQPVESQADGELRNKLSELVEELKQQGQIDALTQETLSALAQSNAQTQDSLTEMKAAIGILREESSRAVPAAATESEELRQSIAEILASGTETGNTVRNLKTSVDEQNNGLKAAIDSGIYGLKQENKELNELLQRMSTAVLRIDENSRSTPAAATAGISDADKQAFEARFNAAEEFMHKESVKVYRNVQAIINEKNDKQKEDVENNNLSVELRVNKVKALVIFNMIFTLINLAVSILYIFGILQM